MTQRKIRKALPILDRITGDDLPLRRAIDAETVHSHIASLLYAARKQAGLTQRQLAQLVGTQQSVIARLESADYQGHSIAMLARIAAALDNRIEVRLVPRKASRRRA